MNMAWPWMRSCWCAAVRFPGPPAARSSAMPVAPPSWPGNSRLSRNIAARRWTMPARARPSAPASRARGLPRPTPCSQFWQAALAAVRQHARALAGAPLPDLTPDTPIAALGLDSLQRLDLVATLEKTFAGRLPDTVFSQARTLEDLVQAVQKHLIHGPGPMPPTGAVPPEHYDLACFPEYGELKRQERLLLAAGDNPYFRVDQGEVGSAPGIEAVHSSTSASMTTSGSPTIRRSPPPPRPRSIAMAPAPAPAA